MASDDGARTLRAVGQVALGAALAGAGIGHLTVQREEFQAQVPPWFPADPDLVVLASGVVAPRWPIVCSTGPTYGVDVTPRLKTLKVAEPPKRSAGIKVADVDELVAKLKAMGVAK